MRTKSNKSRWVILSCILLFLISCATPPKELPYTPQQEVRANLGTIGVVSACFQPEVGFQKPMTKGAAAMQEGPGSAFYLLGESGDVGMGGVILIPIAAVALVVGSIYGAVEGIPAKKIKETEDALNGYLATQNFQETMRDRFLSIARERTQFPFVLIEEQGPKALDEEVTYGAFPDKEIDTLLEISLRKCNLQGMKGHINPPLRLFVAAGIRLIRVKDGKVFHSRNFIYEYESDLHKFSEWAANNAQPFKEELDRAFSYLAMQIVRELINIQAPVTSDSSHATKN